LTVKHKMQKKFSKPLQSKIGKKFKRSSQKASNIEFRIKKFKRSFTSILEWLSILHLPITLFETLNDEKCLEIKGEFCNENLSTVTTYL
jgi:hypothetical protein